VDERLFLLSLLAIMHVWFGLLGLRNKVRRPEHLSPLPADISNFQNGFYLSIYSTLSAGIPLR